MSKKKNTTKRNKDVKSKVQVATPLPKRIPHCMSGKDIIWRGPDPDKIDCRDCAYRAEIAAIAHCGVFRSPNMKPTKILLENAKCPYKVSEKEAGGLLTANGKKK